MSRLFARIGFSLAILAGCTQRPPADIPTKAAATDAGTMGPPTKPGPPARVIALVGQGAIRQAGWVEKSAFAVTGTHLWRFRPEEPEVVKMTPLAAAIGRGEVVAATTASSLVAVGLEDGSIDLLDESGRRRTIPPDPKHPEILDLRFSPDQSVIASFHRGSTWKDETSFFEVATGKLLGKVEGGNVVFDPTGTYVAGRGGVSTLDGKSLWKFAPGFLAETSDGESSGDYVARGFHEGQAFYAARGGKTVEVFDLATRKATSIAASCGDGYKFSNKADSPHGRMIGICSRGVVITDLAARTSSRIAAAIQTRDRTEGADVLTPKDTADFAVWAHFEEPAYVFRSGVASPISPDDFARFTTRDGPATCASLHTARADIPCALPALRPDGAYRLALRRGLVVAKASGDRVIEWPGLPEREPMAADYEWTEERGSLALRSTYTSMRDSAPGLRLDGALASHDPPIPNAGCGAPPKGEKWLPRRSEETQAIYDASRYAGARSVATVVCLCTAQGCVKQEIGVAESDYEYAQDGRPDGTLLTLSHTNTNESSIVRIRRPKGRPVARTFPTDCHGAVFGPDDHVFLACGTFHERRMLYELSPTDLSILTKRPAPPVEDGLTRVGSHLFYGSYSRGILLPFDWVSRPEATDAGELFGDAAYGIALLPDGTTKLAGDPEVARKLLRCYDGERLKPFDTCR